MLKAKRVDFRVCLVAAALVAMVWGFRAMIFHHAPNAFGNPQEDMAFARFVPLFSLFALWHGRRRTLGALGTPSACGLLFALPFLALGFLGVRGMQLRLEIVAFVGLLIATPWALYGRRAAASVLFPALYLLFCIPLATFLDVVTIHLRLFATGAAGFLLQLSGVDIVREGTMLAAADGSFAIDVADPCGGLRSIFALVSFAVAYAYLGLETWRQRFLVVALSVPLAVVGNVMRIVSVCVIAKSGLKGVAPGFCHDVAGTLSFVVAAVLVLIVGELIARTWSAAKTPRLEVDTAPSAAKPPRNGLVVPVAYSLVVVFAMFVQSATPEVTVAEAPDVRLPDIAGYESSPLEPSEAERTVLPADTRIEKRMYRRADGEWFQVSVVVGGASKSSIHRPELCLPAQGFQMSSPRTVEVGGVEWRFLSVESRGKSPLGFAYTFFNQDGFRTASHTQRIFRDVWDRSVHNRIDRWVMLTVSSSRADDESLREIAAALKAVAR